MSPEPVTPLTREEINEAELHLNLEHSRIPSQVLRGLIAGNRRYLALRERILELVDSAENDGCLTGDCSHEYQRGCDAALPSLFSEVLRDLRALLDAPTEER
jgi:hypothetical protein